MIPVIALGGSRHCYFARAVAEGHPRFCLVAVADEVTAPAWSLARSRQLATDLGVPFVDDITLALDRYRPQAACVSPAISRHAELTELACSAGLHVIQDKPMADTLAGCSRILRAVRRAGTRFLLWNRNGNPAIRQARNLLCSGALGKVKAIHIDFYFAKDAGPRIGEGSPEPPPPSWEPFGELSIEGIYPLAYISYLVGSPVTTVFACTSSHFFQRYRDYGIEDLASLSLQLADGTLASICLGRIGQASHPDLGELTLRIVGSEGNVVIAEPRPEVAVYHRDAAPSAFQHRRVAAEPSRYLLDDFADAIDTGRRTTCDEVDGWQVAATVDAALKSARLGQEVAVPAVPNVTNS